MSAAPETHPVPEPLPRPLTRLPGQTLYHAWAPKLRRTIMFTSREQLHLWVMLEAHPGVSRYCVRPSMPDDAGAVAMADFWIQFDGCSVWMAIEAAHPPGSVDPAGISAVSNALVISAGELVRHSAWIQNWLLLMPYLGIASSLSLDNLRSPVIDFFSREASFVDAEQHFSDIDPVLVRSVVITYLHQGLLFSNDLIVRPWDSHTRVVRALYNKREALQVSLSSQESARHVLFRPCSLAQ